MSKKNTKTINWMTPWFTARFPKLQQPDTQGQYADGKFKTDAIFEGDVLTEANEKLTEAFNTFWPGKDLNLPIKTFYANKEDKAAKKNPQGDGITMKSKRKPAILDAKKNRIPDNVKIGGGSIMRAATAISPYEKTEKVKVKDAKTGKVTTVDETLYGVTVYVNAVQIRELKEGGFGAEAFDEDEEGFTYEDTGDAAADQFGDATDL